MSQKDNYGLLIDKLDQFVRKFYVNKLLKGGLYFIGLVLALFLIMSVLEYYLYFGTTVRKVLFFSFIGVSLVSFYSWILKPIFQYFKLGKIISREQAAEIVGEHFTNVQDKLLNIIQLRKQVSTDQYKDLIAASINQKSQELSPISFQSAINLGKNRKYLKYALPPLLLLLIILFAAPSLIKDGTGRLIKNGVAFEKPAPFEFVVQNQNLKVVQFDDYELNVKIEGQKLPNDVFIKVDNYEYRLNKVEKDLFSYTFNNVQKNTPFSLFSLGVNSKKYELDVLEKPNLLGFEVNLDYPGYTQLKDETLSSIGDLVIPAGTNLNWSFNAEKTDKILVRFSDKEEKEEVERIGEAFFTIRKNKFMEDATYRLYISNEELPEGDSIDYYITVVPDLFPNINVEKFQDSIDSKLVYFVGDASDDYGLLNLAFTYKVKSSDGKESSSSMKMGQPVGKQMQFNHTFDLNTLDLKPGDEVSYYFEVFDNDAINGSKSSRSSIMYFLVPTLEELKIQEDLNEDKIKDDLKKAVEESKKIQEEMKKMREKLLQERDLDWQSRKELEKLLEKQKEIEKQIEEAKEKFQENLKNQEQMAPQLDEELLEKQEKLEEMFEEVLSEEMQELMKQIEDLLQELEKDEALDFMEEFEMNDEQLENELDRMLELFKQLELEKEMKETIEELQELAEQQEELSEKTEDSSQEEENQDALQQEQEEIQEKLEDLQEKMDQMEEKNSELENPRDMENRDEEMEGIEKEMENSQQQLQQNQNKKASESQKNASQKMKEMANSMQMQMQSGQMQQAQEDMESLRQLLENLVGLSFDQEDLMNEFDEVVVNTPGYVDLVQQQFKVKDDFKIVEDSLIALSKRVFQIESFVTEKVTEIKENLKSGLEDLEERRKNRASGHQQLTMKNLNDLALMLSETLNQMQQQMASMMPGNQSCDNPGNKPGKQQGQPNDKISEGQKGLNDQMKRMKEALKQGKGSSKEFAQMAARQAALRKALQEKQKQLKESGKGTNKELEELIEKMDETETELVNKRLNNESLNRQQDILTRLLQHEKAEREREYDNKRESKTGEQFERPLPPSLEEYIKKRESEIELYRSVSPSLKPYYKHLVEEYFKNLKSTNK